MDKFSKDMLASKQTIFDAHVHIDNGLTEYDLPNTSKNIIFNTIQSYKDNYLSCQSATNVITLILDLGIDFDFVYQEVKAERVNAVKIHSRIQRLTEDDYELVARRLSHLPDNIPIIIDAFYYGPELQFQPSLSGIILLLTSFSKRDFVIAHSGGYRVLEYFFHLRNFNNCYYDLSFALQYFEDSSLMQDLSKLVKYTDKSKLLFGSDYPYASPHHQYLNLIEMCNKLAISEEDIDRILQSNARQLLTRPIL